MIDTPSGARPGFGRSRHFLSALPDARLVERVRRGNDLAFEVMYDRYSAQLLSFCRHLLGSREEAEDALQHTFMSAYRDLSDGGTRDIKLRPWLYTIARNRCLSIIRSRREQPEEELEVSTAGLSEEVERRADLRDTLRDLQELPADQRAALLLAELGDLSHSEIAEVVGCRPPKVKALVFQGRSALMQRRAAREVPCRDVQAQLAAERGRAARRGVVRRHMAVCPGCAEFYEGVQGQRERLAALLPVIPSIGLKEQALAAAGGGCATTGGSGGLVALVAGESTARYAAAVVLAGGGLLAVGATVTEMGAAGGGPDEPAAAVASDQASSTGRERSRGKRGAESRALAHERAAARRRDASAKLRATARAHDATPVKRRKRRRGSDGPAVSTPPAQGGAPGVQEQRGEATQEQAGRGGGPAEQHGTPRRTRRRPNGGGPSPNASPMAGSPKAPEHPGSTHGGGPNGQANGHSDGRGPNG